MGTYTKKELVKKLNDHFGDKDLLFVLWWSKDEFEASFDKEIKNSVWESAIENIDSESQEQIIKEQIEENLMNNMEESED
ncbi:hypothetical protein EBU71_13865 [bacterium]|nr:hypothetical protein [Candidatus Elulimicrobium humile]